MSEKDMVEMDVMSGLCADCKNPVMWDGFGCSKCGGHYMIPDGEGFKIVKVKVIPINIKKIVDNHFHTTEFGKRIE